MSVAGERRVFSRVTFDAETTVRQGDQQWRVTLMDLSLKGLLVGEPPDWDGDPDRPFEVHMRLDVNTVIRMGVALRHHHDKAIGFECQHIDIDSITHLRRLVELNLGASDLLERELAALWS